MAKDDKALCKRKAGEITKRIDNYMDLVKNPNYLCIKCGRVAVKKKCLHKPVPLK